MKAIMSRRQKAGHDVKKTSCQQNVATHHDVIKFDITSKSASRRQKVYHVVKKCIMLSKSSMTSKRL